MQAFHFFLLFLFLIANSSAFFGKTFSTDTCPIKLYNPNDPSFTGLKLYANAETFHPLLETLSTYAKRCQVKINVKRTFIQKNSRINNMISSDRTSLAFQLGEAIQFDLVDKYRKVICNRLCLNKSLSHLKREPAAKCFLKKISRDPNLQQDLIKPTILMKRTKPNESVITLNDKQKDLQNKCKKLELY